MVTASQWNSLQWPPFLLHINRFCAIRQYKADEILCLVHYFFLYILFSMILSLFYSTELFFLEKIFILVSLVHLLVLLMACCLHLLRLFPLHSCRTILFTQQDASEIPLKPALWTFPYKMQTFTAEQWQPMKQQGIRKDTLRNHERSFPIMILMLNVFRRNAQLLRKILISY